MPPRKEPKEVVVYPASKRKVPPFKPQRPSKVARTDSQTDATPQPHAARSIPSSRNVSATTDKSGAEDENRVQRSTAMDTESSDSEEELAANPLAVKPKQTKSTMPAPARRKPSRQSSPVSVSPDREADAPDPNNPASLSQSSHPTIPQALLVRLLHEHFVDKKTKIDKDAIQVLQRYLEVFVREAIARAQLQKQQGAEEAGKVGEVDVSWLELEDLEKVAAGMLLDF